MGSNPVPFATISSVGQVVKTPAFHAGIRGSIPLPSTKTLCVMTTLFGTIRVIEYKLRIHLLDFLCYLVRFVQLRFDSSDGRANGLYVN